MEADPVRRYGGEPAAVAVTRAGRPDPAALLGSLAAATSRPLCLVVADSPSPEPIEALDGVEVVRLAEDLGRAAALNRAVAGLPGAVGWVLLAEPGVRFRPGCLDTLLAAAAGYPRAALIGPRLFGPEGARPTGGALPTVSAAARGRVRPEVPGPGPTGWLSTAAVLVRRSAWDSVDGLDPRYLGGPGDMGDVDMGERLARAGWLVVHEPRAVVDVVAVGEGDEPFRIGHGILEPHAVGLRRYVHDRRGAPLRVLLALIGWAQSGWTRGGWTRGGWTRGGWTRGGWTRSGGTRGR